MQTYQCYVRRARRHHEQHLEELGDHLGALTMVMDKDDEPKTIQRMNTSEGK